MTDLTKSPAAALAYAVDWGVRAPVTAPDWRIDPPGLALTDARHDGRVSRVRLTGGRPGETYRVTARATFADGAERLRGLTLAVEAR